MTHLGLRVEAPFSMRHMSEANGKRGADLTFQERRMKRFSEGLSYLLALTSLLISREIGPAQWLWAARNRPPVVAGRSCGHVMDSTSCV